jgi:mono/diheme cytochrome c family protein
MRAALAGVTVLLGVLAGCERGLHQMYEQPKYKPLTPTLLFTDNNSSRPQVQGTVVYSSGSLAGSSSGRRGAPGSSDEPPVSEALLSRGRTEFEIFCTPCHSEAGDGDGMVARRGFPAPPSYHIARLRSAPDSHFYDVITNGYGVMYPYGDRIAPHDRWAIVAYIRALQLSQHAPVAALSQADLAKLAESTR